ncbi:MAG: hypothetical protein MUF03_01965 [Rubrivivax sp.]|jgi:MSHA biogenesis protein MshI|nr:hypothetical protein [Rubrivivax sp.]
MKWPWRREGGGEQLVVGGDADTLAWVHAGPDRVPRRAGIERRGADTPQEFARRVRALGLPARGVTAVLPLHETQLLQVEAPAVRPEEMKAAARWRIKDAVEGRVDELTIDVVKVGDGRAAAQRHVFVAAARNALVRETTERCQAMGLQLATIDIPEMAQRNLQCAAAAADGFAGRANAALVVHGTTALLTICAADELFYARRLDWDGIEALAPAPVATPAAALDDVDFIDYGAFGDTPAASDGAPRLVIELQRSFDVWERQWPDLPLAGLWVRAGADSATLAARLHDLLGLRVTVLDPARALPGGSPAVTDDDALLPLYGGLLRQESREL